MTTPLRKRIYTSPELGEFARDVERTLDGFRPSRLHETIELYTEPMYLGTATDPRAITLLRCRIDATPEAALDWGAVSYVWEQALARVRIVDIAGLTAGVKYRMLFEVVG